MQLLMAMVPSSHPPRDEDPNEAERMDLKLELYLLHQFS